MHRLTPSTHAGLRAGSRAGAAALLAAGAIVLGAPAATADPTAPLGSPSTGAGVSSAVFQSATCSASGGYSALVTLTNAAPETQTFSFTTGAGGGATPAATSVGAGQSLTVRVSTPSQARAIFVTTASGGSAGSLPLSGCGDAPSTSSTLSATAEPTRTPRQSTSPAPTSDEPTLAPTIASTGASSPASPPGPHDADGTDDTAQQFEERHLVARIVFVFVRVVFVVESFQFGVVDQHLQPVARPLGRGISRRIRLEFDEPPARRRRCRPRTARPGARRHRHSPRLPLTQDRHGRPPRPRSKHTPHEEAPSPSR